MKIDRISVAEKLGFESITKLRTLVVGPYAADLMLFTRLAAAGDLAFRGVPTIQGKFCEPRTGQWTEVYPTVIAPHTGTATNAA